MRTAAVLAGLLVLTLPLPACQWPRDAEGTLDRVTGGTLRVGLVEAEPWVVLDDDEPDGVEVRLVEELAARLHTEVEWVQGSESALMDALHVRAVDLVVGGHWHKFLHEPIFERMKADDGESAAGREQVRQFF